MAARDPHRFANELDEAALGRLVDRLESRARDSVFSSLFERYLDRVLMSENARILEMGCGTGTVSRAIAKRESFDGQVVGVDQSPHFISAARRFAQREQLGERVEFEVGDVHGLDYSSAAFDIVVANTLISHVTDPREVLAEMARLVRPEGLVVIFDGDYASLTFACPDLDFGRMMDEALANATFNNPYIMRELPRLFGGCGLEIESAWGEAVVEIGQGSYFKTFAETYAPYVVKAGYATETQVDAWLDDQRRAMEEGTFFAACNYYTYLARPLRLEADVPSHDTRVTAG